MVAYNVFALAAILPAMVLASSAGHHAPGSIQRRHHNKVKTARSATTGERNTARALKRKRNTHRKRKCRPAHGAEGTDGGAAAATEGSTWVDPAATEGTDAATFGAADFGNEFHAAPADDHTVTLDEHAPAVEQATTQNSSGPAPVPGDLQIGRTLTGPCGTITTTADAPNGPQWWLTCGISMENPDSPWNPPFLGPNDIVSQDFEHGDWAGCEAYAWAFTDPTCNLGINPAILASIARQESSCNPDVRGKNGEYGLMQVMPFNCVDESKCMDIWWNIHSGATVLKHYLDQSGGNIIVALGKYNGWSPTASYNTATKAFNEGNCWAQNNLDYHQQMLNGFCVGVNAYVPEFYTQFKNYARCS